MKYIQICSIFCVSGCRGWKSQHCRGRRRSHQAWLHSESLVSGHGLWRLPPPSLRLRSLHVDCCGYQEECGQSHRRGIEAFAEEFPGHHRAMLDMQRQCGNASLFRTRAPYERSFPYHQWVMHEQHVQGKARLHLPVAETLHIAWVLLQLDAGYIRGAKKTMGRGDRTWRDHVLGPKDEESAVGTVVSYATRLEFQDGKRKPAQQRYHGRGTVHSHSLDFLENVDLIGLEEKLQATIPDQETEPFLRGLVLDSQQDYRDSNAQFVKMHPHGTQKHRPWHWSTPQ